MGVKTYVNSAKTVKASKGNVNKPITRHESYSVPNFGGGYSLQMKPLDILERFLILGVEGTYFAFDQSGKKIPGKSGAQVFLEQNHQNIVTVLGTYPQDAYKLIYEISTQKRSISNYACLYATAVLCAHPDTNIRQLGYNLVPSVCRTGTHVFNFCEMVTSMRGWSRGLRNAVNQFYTLPNWDNFVYQTLKYRQRDGWSVKDVFRCTHPDFGSNFQNGTSVQKNALANYIVNNDRDTLAFDNLVQNCAYGGESKGSKQVLAYLEMLSWKQEDKSNKQMKQLIKLIEYANLTHEFIPTWYKNEAQVQEALLQNMPVGATIRNLAAYTASGLLGPFGSASKLVVDRITNPEILKKAGIHPLQVFTTSRIYNQGKGELGSLVWGPNSKISSALEDCFNLSFSSAPVVGKNFMLSVDVSGSMSFPFQNKPFTYCEIAAVIALTMVKREPNTYAVCFSNTLHDLNLTDKDTLQTATSKARQYNCGSTNAGLPIEKAIKEKLPVDVFLHITDNDYNAGKHPLVLTEEFRNKMNRPKTRLMSIGLIPSTYGTVGFASEKDPYSLDIKGFDSSIPQIIHSFCSDTKKSEQEIGEED